MRMVEINNDDDYDGIYAESEWVYITQHEQ